MTGSAPSRLTARGATALLVGSWALFFSGALVHLDQVPYYRDHLVTNVPVRDAVRERLLSGELPQWFPYEGLGVPVIGQIALGTFHPLNLLATPLPAPQGEKWVVLVAYLLSLLGAYKAARATGVGRGAAVLGAWAFTFGGFSLGVSCIVAYVLSFAALPWVVWASLRLVEKQRLKDAALLAACASLVFLAGDALAFVACAGLGAIAFSAGPSRRSALLFALAGAWASALVAVELLPATALGAEALRNVGQAPPSLAFTWATHPLRLLELVLPGFVPDAERARVLQEALGGGTSTFATTLYLGVVTFGALAAALGRELPRASRIALGAGLFCVLLALGGHLGLLGLLGRALPLLGKFRYPERYLAFFWVGLLWVVPYGFQRVLGAARAGFWAGTGVAAALNLALALPFAVSAVWALGGHGADPALAQAVGGAWRSAGLVGAALALGAGAVLFVRTPNLRGLLLGALLFLDLFRGNAAHLPLVSASLYQPSPFAEHVQRAPGSVTGPAPAPRVMPLATRQWPSGVTLPGREEWVLSTLARLRASSSELSRVQTLDSNLGAVQRRHALVFGPRDEHLAAVGPFFDGCWEVVDAERARGEAFALPAFGLALEPAACWPRAFLAQAVPASTDEAVALVQQARLDTPRVPWEGGPAVDSSEGTVRWVESTPERRVVEVEAPRPTALVVSEDFVPGWSATVDGAKVAIHPAMVTALGVEVPAGTHRVALEFRTPRLLPGAVLSLLGWIACAFVLLRRRPKVGPSPAGEPVPPARG